MLMSIDLFLQDFFLFILKNELSLAYNYKSSVQAFIFSLCVHISNSYYNHHENENKMVCDFSYLFCFF